MKKTITFPTVTVRNARLDRNSLSSDNRTGSTDGSGTIDMAFRSAKQQGDNVLFSGVVIEAESNDSISKGYATASDNSLRSEAENYLRNDFCEEDED